MSHRVTPSEQGQLQGALSSIMGITGMVGPGVFTLTFAHFISPARSEQMYIPGAPFLMAACLVAIAALVAWRVTRPGMLEARPPAPDAPANSAINPS